MAKRGRPVGAKNRTGHEMLREAKNLERLGKAKIQLEKAKKVAAKQKRK